MHFELTRVGDELLVKFVSSKETVVLGKLQFVDEDGDVRGDIMKLLTVAVGDNPLFEVKGMR